MAENTCSRIEDSTEIDGPSRLIQETAESGDLINLNLGLLGFMPNLS